MNAESAKSISLMNAIGFNQMVIFMQSIHTTSTWMQRNTHVRMSTPIISTFISRQYVVIASDASVYRNDQYSCDIVVFFFSISIFIAECSTQSGMSTDDLPRRRERNENGYSHKSRCRPRYPALRMGFPQAAKSASRADRAEHHPPHWMGTVFGWCTACLEFLHQTQVHNVVCVEQGKCAARTCATQSVCARRHSNSARIYYWLDACNESSRHK